MPNANKKGKSRAPTRGPKLFKTRAERLPEEDQYCVMCDDGGQLIECDLCHTNCCYNEREERLDVTDEELADKACITLPAGFLQDALRIFRCPGCLAKYPEAALDYTVNRGMNTTQRRTVSTHLVIIIACLPQLQERGQHIFEAVQATLRGFEVMITSFSCQLPNYLNARDINTVLSSKGPYHLVFAFITESNPTGGWWFREGAQQSEGTWLKGLLARYDTLARSALSARIFGLCCGVNLPGEGVIREISETLQQLKWHSLVLPAASAVFPEEYGSILPELFLQLYYNGAEFKSALLRVWAGSKRCRLHTDLFVAERIQDEEKMSIRKYTYAAEASRPWGIDLPLPNSFCNCDRINVNPRWDLMFKAKQVQHREHFACYRSACGHTFVRVAVFDAGFRALTIRGTQVVQQDFDIALDRFPLDNPQHVAIKVSMAGDTLPNGTRRKVEHKSAWTILGKEAWTAEHPE